MKLLKFVLMIILVVSYIYGNDIEVLVDTSGSMQGREGDVLKMLRDIRQKAPNIGISLFNDTIQRINAIPQNLKMKGSTNLSGALENIKTQNPKAIIIITDGRPNDENMAKKALDEYRKNKTVVCAGYIGDETPPDLLRRNTDHYFQNINILSVIPSCIKTEAFKPFVPEGYRVELDNPYDEWGFDSMHSSANRNSHIEARQNLNHDKALVVMLDASAENYECESLRESNLRYIQNHFLTPGYLKNQQIKSLKFVLFSQNTEFIGVVIYRDFRHGPDRARQRKFLSAIHRAFRDTKNRMQEFNRNRQGRDVAGAIQSVIHSMYDDHGYDNVTIVLASDMLQSVNRRTTNENLQSNPIQLPDHYRMIILGKAFACDHRGSENDRIRAILNTKSFWLNVIRSNNPIEYKTQY